jgi:hypothetical protein
LESEHEPPAPVSCVALALDEEQQEPAEAFEAVAEADEALSWSQAMALAAPIDTAMAAASRVNLRMESSGPEGPSVVRARVSRSRGPTSHRLCP